MGAPAAHETSQPGLHTEKERVEDPARLGVFRQRVWPSLGTEKESFVGTAASVDHRYRASLSLKIRHQVAALLLSRRLAYHKAKPKMTTGLLSLEMAGMPRSPSLHLSAAKLFLGPCVTKGLWGPTKSKDVKMLCKVQSTVKAH